MTSGQPVSKLKLFILSLGTVVLAMNTFFYYTAQAAEQSSDSEKESPLAQLQNHIDTEIKPSPSPDIPPSFEISDLSLISIKKVDASQIEAAQVSFTGATLSGKLSEVNVYKLKYKIKGKDLSWQPVTANVYVPTAEGKYPLFVFGSGTTGMADRCAPSLENMAVENLGNYDNHMIAQAAEGYVSVFPDYEGFHSPAAQSYFIVESEAKVLIGAVKAIMSLQESSPELKNVDMNKVFLSGYSQGGHAALSASKEWQALPSTIKIQGIVQYAGAADVEALFLESPWLASYLVDSYTQYYGEQLEPQLVLQDRWLIPLAKNNQMCVNQAYKFYPHDPATLYNPAFLDAVQTQTWPVNLTAWQKRIQQNVPLTNLPDVPYLSVQGATDPIVTAKAQRKNVEKLCQQGKNVQYRELAGVNHFQVRQRSFVESNAWMKSVLAGEPQKSDCP